MAIQPAYASCLLLLAIICISACDSGDSTGESIHERPTNSDEVTEPAPLTATETIDEMLMLARAGDWASYVDRFYGETDKFTSPADRDALVARFQGPWSERVLTALERAAGVDPEIQGDQAVFNVDGEPAFVLHRDADERWTFHL